jgi:hypothetical protein
VEPTLADLQLQIDHLSAAVAREREAPGSTEALDELSELAERCREILRRWTEMDDRHAEAIGEVEARLGEWNAIESRLERESSDRLRALEESIEREWKTLKDIHEAPARQLKEQADTLSQTSMAAANLSLKAFERTEARLAAFEEDIQHRLTQLSNDLHSAVNQMRREGPVGSALPPAVAPFPLAGVMRIHEEHRDADGTDGVDAAASVAGDPHGTVDVPSMATPPRAALPAAASEWVDRLAVLEREMSTDRQDARDAVERSDKQHRRETFTTFLIVVGLLAVAGFFGYRLEQDVTNRIQDANTRVAAAEHQAQTASDTASREVASARADADKQIADARETARRADVTSSVLASGDLLRLNLEGADATGRASGQAWFSRSSGLVVNASHVAALAPGTVYQVWLIGSGGPVAAGFLDPDTAGHAVLATNAPPEVPRPVNGLMVTIEPTGGRPAPTGQILLTRAPQ